MDSLQNQSLFHIQHDTAMDTPYDLNSSIQNQSQIINER